MTNREADPVATALNLDPLATANALTGRSYKDDPTTMALGFQLFLFHSQRKESLLRQTRDSYHSMSFTDQMTLFTELGFAEVYRETFPGTYGQETYVILWQPAGLLATCESWSGTDRNSAKVYYNYRHQSGGYPNGLTSSGGMHGNVWVGDHDAREGIRHNLNAMRDEGQFLSTWVERPFLWLLNYSEKGDGCDYEAINEDKIARLPQLVRHSITPAQPQESSK